MDIFLFWKLLNNGRIYGEQSCKRLQFDDNSTNTKICLYLLTHSRVSQYDIASAYHMAESTVAKAMNRLEKEKLVLREISPMDRRVKLVSLTPRGIKAYTPIREIQNSWARQLSDSLTQAENAEFDRLCRKVLLGSEKLLDSNGR